MCLALADHSHLELSPAQQGRVERTAAPAMHATQHVLWTSYTLDRGLCGTVNGHRVVKDPSAHAGVPSLMRGVPSPRRHRGQHRAYTRSLSRRYTPSYTTQCSDLVIRYRIKLRAVTRHLRIRVSLSSSPGTVPLEKAAQEPVGIGSLRLGRQW